MEYTIVSVTVSGRLIRRDGLPAWQRLAENNEIIEDDESSEVSEFWTPPETFHVGKERLTEYVNEHLEEGWRPSGSMVVHEHGSTGWILCQPMIRE